MPAPKPEHEHRKGKYFRLAPETLEAIAELRKAWGIKSDARVIDRAIKEAEARERNDRGT